MSVIREGFEVEFECRHRMVYDGHSQHGVPELGELGVCRQCGGSDQIPVERIVVGTRPCWIETTTKVHFTKPEDSRGGDQ